MSNPVERRPRTPNEHYAISEMKCVTFPVASWDKRFYRHLSSMDTISEKEAPQLWRIFIKYRRQMSFPGKDAMLRFAEANAAPDLRKVEAARREQAEIDDLKAKYAAQMATKDRSCS